MEHVAGDDKGDCEDGDFRAAGSAAAKPGCVVEGADQRDGGAANGGELLEQIGKFASGGVCHFDVIILFETGKWRLIAACNAKNTVREDALGIVHVAESFPDGPFAGSVAEIGLLVGKRLQYLFHIPKLRFEDFHKIPV